MIYETIEINNKEGDQAIPIPKRMHIDDDKVYLKKIGNVIYIIPFHNPWQNLIESTENFTTDFMDTRSQTSEQIRESLD